MTGEGARDPSTPVTACLLVIGNEILSGRTEDKNVAYLGRRLNELGIRLQEVRVIPDEELTIAETVNAVRPRFDYVFTTGGIGPTHDDITAQSIARAFGQPLIVHPEARTLLERQYDPENLNEARLRMARTPEGAELIPNPVSRAPGFLVENVYVMAGIPSIMQAMFESVRHRLTGGLPLLSRSVTAKLAEGTLAAGLSEIQDRFANVEIGSYPFTREGGFAVRIVLRSVEEARLDEAADAVDRLIGKLGVEAEWDTAA